MFLHHQWGRRSSVFIPALLVALFSCLLFGWGLFGPVEDALTSKRADWQTRPPTGETLIVEIDARSLAELRNWPWPRRYHAQLVHRLHEAGASIIAFDVDFSARSTIEDDEAFAGAIREAGHVILPIFEQRSSGRQDDRRVLTSRPDPRFSDAWVGGVNIFPDEDGVVRDYPAATFAEGSIQPAIATLLAEKNGLGDRIFQPDWAIDANLIPRLSFVDVIKGRIPNQIFRGKRVLIGATAVEMGDRYPVPRYGILPGVVVQALATESLLQDRAIKRTGLAVTLVGILLIALLLAPRPVERPWRRALLFGLVTVLILVGPLAVLWIWPVAIDTAAWLFTAISAAAVQTGFEARRRLRQRENFDADSGLPNRLVLDRYLSANVATSPLLVAAAIERFEAIRDGLGLAATNELIRNAAAIIGRHVGGPVYRVAPDTLAWVLTDGDEATLTHVLKRLQSAFREPVVTSDGSVDATFTLGLARMTAGIAPVLLIEHALSAITTARSLGKSHEWYRGTDPQLRRQLSMMSELRDAMENGRLSLAYQPKLSLSTGRIADAEALIRWRDSTGKFLSPDEFIPLAEATGVICEVTTFALRTAMVDLTKWSEQGLFIRAAVNVSALDLNAPDFASRVCAVLDEFDVPPSQLTLEVTESALIRSAADVAETLSTLRKQGIRLSVDDYGTGQSTLSYLKHLPVHELKIDKSFVMNLSDQESDMIMVRSTINLAHELGLEVVAEGIEDQQTLGILRDLGCNYAQGYEISKPLSPDDFAQLVLKSARSRRVA